MRVCMVTPHLPPEQSANALLPAMLGDALVSSGVVASYVSHPPAPPARLNQTLDITYVPRRGRGPVSRTKAGAVAAGIRMIRGARAPVRSCDLVHLHGNGFIVEVGQWLAMRYRKPYIVTLYGTDVSAHNPGRHARYGAVVRSASYRVFYSHGLLEHARRLGLAPAPAAVIYAPVAARFRPLDEAVRAAARREHGIGSEPVLLTVKRLHPVAGHDSLLSAMPMVLERFPDARLWLAGDGERRQALESQCRTLGIGSQVRFLGRIDNEDLPKYCAAADVFVLPSLVESWGTVMLESLASGTPVVTTDTIGGREVGGMFPEDVLTAPVGDPVQLADAVSRALLRRSRTSASTQARIQREFSVAACASQYHAVYEQALSGAGSRP